MHTRTPKRQRGIALVTALLMVALATTSAVAMVSSQHLDIRRVQNVLARDQALSYSTAADLWGIQILKDKLARNPDTDHLGEEWAQPKMLPEFDGARLAMQIHDAQGRFNINNLASVPPDQVQNHPYVQQFRRLLLVAEVEGDHEAIVNAVLDWLDPDFEVRFPGGAEDDVYTSLEQPYRAANRRMLSVSELRLVQGITDEIYLQIEPFLSALPGQTTLNINTASAPVLRIIHNLDEQTAETLVEQRPDEGYTDVNEMLALLPGQEFQGENTLSVRSDYFELETSVSLGPARVRMRSLVQRGQDALRILARSQGPL